MLYAEHVGSCKADARKCFNPTQRVRYGILEKEGRKGTMEAEEKRESTAPPGLSDATVVSCSVPHMRHRI